MSLWEHEEYRSVFGVSGNSDAIMFYGKSVSKPLKPSLVKTRQISHPSQESLYKSLYSLSFWYLEILP